MITTTSVSTSRRIIRRALRSSRIHGISQGMGSASRYESAECSGPSSWRKTISSGCTRLRIPAPLTITGLSSACSLEHTLALRRRRTIGNMQTTGRSMIQRKTSPTPATTEGRFPIRCGKVPLEWSGTRSSKAREIRLTELTTTATLIQPPPH